jgi:phosphomethylpyrimidine synthase
MTRPRNTHDVGWRPGIRQPFFYDPPYQGANNPSSTESGTAPASFALRADIGGPYAYSSPDTPGMPMPSAYTAWDFMPHGWTPVEIDERRQRLRSTIRTEPSPSAPFIPIPPRRYEAPADFTAVTQLEHARLGAITAQMQRIAEREGHLTPEQVRDEVASGRMIILANRAHLSYQLDPVAIGRAAHTKINANLGASPVSSDTKEEIEKLNWAVRFGADAAMDLSTGGNLDECREAIIHASTVPIGTVPIYSMIIGRKVEDLTEEMILAEIEKQAKQGVDFMTVHAGVLREHLPFVKDRLIGIVSRGGSLLAKWMLHHDRQNPMYELWDEICDILREYDVAFSIGDGLRPGGLADATDEAQLRELDTLGELTERAWAKGVQVMIEGPGHIPFDQIEYNMKIERRLCHGAPFYVLGPLVTDVFPGYDHITSCIGATAAAYHGASMLCYVTPKEHLGLPKKDDVKQGCIAYKIAAHAADVALGLPGARDWDDDLTRARAALNWDKHFELAFDPDTARALHDEDLDVDTDFCAMCGHDWCAVRISKEIQSFASGKDETYAWRDPKISAALTVEQRRILEERGVLSPEEIHRLASKTKEAMEGERDEETKRQRDPTSERAGSSSSPGADEHDSSSKPACHSDYVPDPEEARRLQQQRME